MIPLFRVLFIRTSPFLAARFIVAQAPEVDPNSVHLCCYFCRFLCLPRSSSMQSTKRLWLFHRKEK
jgi:hypothetical protein